ncbi:MAG: sodium:alanine symporter family protein [Parachlamydiales bacterium]|nr:sodium:alanine symporter family protein [Verrucomicrobiota bacterium]MBX3719784.1 sodium:alanine symporter family protein [Candidatus Acheromyda pituitae]
MDTARSLVDWLNLIDEWMWGHFLVILLVGIGLFFTIRFRGMQFRYLGYSLKLAFTRQDEGAQGDISQFQALMTALAATIGIGSIAGVATAIVAGGFGAVFWMWIIALIGMVTKFIEAILAVKYRVVDEKGQMSGGPMYYIANGLGWKWLGALFAVFCSLSAFAGGNLIQANSITAAVSAVTPFSPVWIGLTLSVVTGVVLLGGIKSIGKISSYLVPIMALTYVVGGLMIIILRIDQVPAGLMAIVKTAFTGQAAFGGFLGASVMAAVQMGVARGVSSNEAGLGSAPIAAAAAKTDVPGRQALISMSGVFLSSLVVCSITALVISVTGVLGKVGADGKVLNGALLVMEAFRTVIPGGDLLVTICLILFGYTTIIGWAYYGERCMEFLAGEKVLLGYRVVFCAFAFLGAVMSFDLVWPIADIMNGLMSIPNLIGIIGLTGIISVETRAFFDLLEREKLAKPKTV